MQAAGFSLHCVLHALCSWRNHLQAKPQCKCMGPVQIWPCSYLTLFESRRTFLIQTQQSGTQAHCCKDAQVMPVPRDSGVLPQSQSHILTVWHHLEKSIFLSCPSVPFIIGASALQPVSRWQPGCPERSHILSVLHSYLEGDSGRGFVIVVVIPSGNQEDAFVLIHHGWNLWSQLNLSRLNVAS